VESSDDAIISKSLDGTIQSWNLGAERLFGYRADEAIGRHISLVIPPDRMAEEDEIVANLRAGRRIDHFETERMRADGSRVFVSLTISPLRDDAGIVIGRVQDRARHHQAAGSWKTTCAASRPTSPRRTIARTSSWPCSPTSSATRSRRSATRFTSFAREMATAGAVQEVGAMLERQVKQMARLVDDLLDMSRITRGTIELRTQPIELAPVVRQAVESSKSWCDDLEHQLTVSVSDEPLGLRADPARLVR
jgi:PAS domain S-box-containing protein